MADASQPIIADFLTHYNLSTNLKSRRLYDPLTGITTNATKVKETSTQLCTISADNRYAHILKQYPSLTQPYSAITPVKHHASYYIETTGPPTHAKAIRLAPERYRAAKAEFESLLQQGIIRPSFSNWSSPLHILSKKNGYIRPCGDYRVLNAKSVMDRYPIPNIQDFSAQLTGRKLFANLDLVKAFHQIPVNHDAIRKTGCLNTRGCRLD